MWVGLAYVSDASRWFLPRSFAAVATAAHDAGVVAETSGVNSFAASL
jgi:hypothetical protein